MSVRTDTEVKLLISGRELTRWESYEVESDLFGGADAFHFEARNCKELAGVVLEEDEVRVLVDGELVMVGRVDEVQYQGGIEGDKLVISGRDRGRYLEDCSAEPCSLENQNLTAIAERVAGAWIPVWLTSGNVTLGTVSKLKVDPGDSPYQVINELAERVGAVVWLDEQGRGVIGKPNYAQKPLYSLWLYGPESSARVKNNVVSRSLTRSSRERFSEVRTLASRANAKGCRGSAASKLKGVAIDAGVTNKPKIVTGSCYDTGHAEKRAQDHVDRARFKAWCGVYTVRDHRNSGELWRINTLCTLVDELAGISGDTLFVSRRRFFFDGQGRQTEVELHPKGVWLT